MGLDNNSTSQRTWKQLSEKERYKIEVLSQQGLTPAEIGAALTPKRHRRTIERELKRGAVEQRDSQWHEKRVYCADAGQRMHEERSANKAGD